jgi:Zn-dependent membrane protease YugP
MALIILALLLVVIFGPQLWARQVLRANAKERDDIEGTGAEFARHLLDNAHLAGYGVEKAHPNVGDHFDPTSRMVRLSELHHDHRSLSAIVVAAHEVGHAIQDHIGYPPLKIRTRLALAAGIAQKIASFALIAMPVVALLTRIPAAGVAVLLLGIGVMLIPVLIHLVTLPVEFDASFKRALPILKMGYLSSEDLPKAKRILTACALTYLSSSLASLLNLWRWMKILRR